MFNPRIIGLHDLWAGAAVYQAISRCNAYIQKALYKNLVFSGGNTMHPGFRRRVTLELLKHCSNSVIILPVESCERKLSAWIGGSIVGSLSTFKEMTMSKAQYEENGPHYTGEWKIEGRFC